MGASSVGAVFWIAPILSLILWGQLNSSFDVLHTHNSFDIGIYVCLFIPSIFVLQRKRVSWNSPPFLVVVLVFVFNLSSAGKLSVLPADQSCNLTNFHMVVITAHAIYEGFVVFADDPAVYFELRESGDIDGSWFVADE